MNLRQTARAIVVRNDTILLIERWRSKDHYFALPGGGIEPGETPEVAVVRELFEETKILARPRLIVLRERDATSQHAYFLCDFLSGEAELPRESGDSTNRYKPIWLPLETFLKLSPSEFNVRLWPVIKDILNGKIR